MTATCGQCGQGVEIPHNQRVGICYTCKAAISLPGTPITEIIAAMLAAGVPPPHHPPEDYDRQMQDWAMRNGVKPIYPQTQPDFPYPQMRPDFPYTPPQPLQPDRVARDAAAAFGRESENADRATFYASWSAYDAALQGFPPGQQDLQRKAEVLELERMLSL